VQNRIVALYIVNGSVATKESYLSEFNEMLRRDTSVALNSLDVYPPLSPKDEDALDISRLIAKLLNQTQLIGKDFQFGQAGIDSITAAHVLNVLKKKHSNAMLMPEDLLDDDITPSSLSQRLKLTSFERKLLSQEDLDKEAEKLALELPELSLRPVDNPKLIVLTGATGYLGSFILADLLSVHKTAHIICISRSGGLKRILQALKGTRMALPADSHTRVLVMEGDLSKPNLGLAYEDRIKLDKADLIIHNAALVHWTRSYKTLLSANVLSLVFLLKHAKSLTFVSGGGQTALDENNQEAFRTANGYTQTKYVAEKICRLVGARIVRPGYILGDPVCNSDDFIWRFVKVCIELDSFVEVSKATDAMNAASVTEVARRVAHAKDKPLDRIWVE